MNILIIGSKGFIGSHLLKYLSQQQNIVCYGCDIIKDSSSNYFYITNFKYDFNKLLELIKFDYCINCSGSANVKDSFVNTLNDFDLNVSNVILILDSLKHNLPLCKFINLSSAAVYGNPKGLPILVSDKENPISPYGMHKYLSEKLCFEYYKAFQIPTLSLRIFSAYGPGLKKQIFWDWYCKAINNELILLNGTGNESRDYIFIDDLVKIIHLVIINGKFNGSCINVGNGSEIFIKDIAKIFFTILNRTFEFTGNRNEADPINWFAEISQLKQWGYVQKISISNGIAKYIEWARELN